MGKGAIIMVENIDIIEQGIADRSEDLLGILLRDKTTGGYIKWCTDNYSSYGESYYADKQMFPSLVIGGFTHLVQPRVSKTKEEQRLRTKEKGEVFTPTWIVNQQNNLIDEAWFGRKGVFNKSYEQRWKTNNKKIEFPDNKTWQQYVDLKRLEVSCGEAPYLVNRYDTVSGKVIPINNRVGLLDRKLRVINENVDNETEWEKWVIRAFQSTYGYEYQGDNVLLARENLLYTYWDNMIYKFSKEPSLIQQKKIANIIAWNVWQMEGISMTVPYSEAEDPYHQESFFKTLGLEEPRNKEVDPVPCKIFDWRANESLEFRDIVRGDLS